MWASSRARCRDMVNLVLYAAAAGGKLPRTLSVTPNPGLMGGGSLYTTGAEAENSAVRGEASLLTIGVFLLTVKLLCLQSIKALIRRTFPL